MMDKRVYYLTIFILFWVGLGLLIGFGFTRIFWFWIVGILLTIPCLILALFSIYVGLRYGGPGGSARANVKFPGTR